MSFYILISIVGLSYLVLIIQKPIVTDAEIIDHIFSPKSAETVVNLCDANILKVFKDNQPDLGWKYQEISLQYTSATAISVKKWSLLRYLNQREAEHANHVLLLTEDPEIRSCIRNEVENDLSQSEYVTIPILRAQVAAGEFSIVASVIFVSMFIYAHLHWRHFYNYRKDASGTPLLHVTPSLFCSTNDELHYMPESLYKLISVAKFIVFYLLPILLLPPVVYRLHRSNWDFNNEVRLTTSGIIAIIGCVVSVFFFVQASRAEERLRDFLLPLFSNTKRK